MFSSTPGGQPALLLAGMLCGVGAAACSKGAERSPPVDTVSVTNPGPPAYDTASARADTSKIDTSSRVSASTTGSSPARKATMDTPPKPSIDPGRKTTKPIRVPRTTSTPTQDSQGQPLSYDAGSNTVTFQLIAGPFNFNGYTNGAATLSVPPKANMVINFVNKDGTPHSAEVISGDGPIPNASTDPAIPRAYTNKALEGLPQEATDVMRFAMPESGKYRIFCGVPGHGLSGMWIWLKVDPAAKTPSFGPTKA